MISFQNQLFQNGRLTVFQSALFQTTSAVVEAQDGILVVDPTWLPAEVEEIAEFVRSVRRERSLSLLFTHSDFDHILGYGAFPDALTIASREFVDNPDKNRSVNAVLAWDSEYYVQRPYDIRYPQIDIVAAQDGRSQDGQSQDGQSLVLGEMRLAFYGASGHNPDGLFTVIEPHGILIAGDYLSDIEFPYIYQSSTAYEETLHKLDGILERHTINVLVPGHGRVTTDSQEMRERQKKSFEYIHALRQHIATDDQAALDRMLDEYAFPGGMKSFHEGNQRLMRAEAVAEKSGNEDT